MPINGNDYKAPHESYPEIFLRFPQFGSLAWGGPEAQITMIREELAVEEQTSGNNLHFVWSCSFLSLFIKSAARHLVFLHLESLHREGELH